MNILFVQWNSIGQQDLEEAFILEGHKLLCVNFSHNELQQGNLSKIERELLQLVKSGKPDIVFTVDYFPYITTFCSCHKLRYVSWVYDSPHDAMYSEEIVNPCSIYLRQRNMFRISQSRNQYSTLSSYGGKYRSNEQKRYRFAFFL